MSRYRIYHLPVQSMLYALQFNLISLGLQMKVFMHICFSANAWAQNGYNYVISQLQQYFYDIELIL